jgi:hypothetical protein
MINDARTAMLFAFLILGILADFGDVRPPSATDVAAWGGRRVADSFRAAPAFAISTTKTRVGAELFLWFLQKRFVF